MLSAHPSSRAGWVFWESSQKTGTHTRLTTHRGIFPKSCGWRAALPARQRLRGSQSCTAPRKGLRTPLGKDCECRLEWVRMPPGKDCEYSQEWTVNSLYPPVTTQLSLPHTAHAASLWHQRGSNSKPRTPSPAQPSPPGTSPSRRGAAAGSPDRARPLSPPHGSGPGRPEGANTHGRRGGDTRGGTPALTGRRVPCPAAAGTPRAWAAASPPSRPLGSARLRSTRARRRLGLTRLRSVRARPRSAPPTGRRHAGAPSYSTSRPASAAPKRAGRAMRSAALLSGPVPGPRAAARGVSGNGNGKGNGSGNGAGTGVLSPPSPHIWGVLSPTLRCWAEAGATIPPPTLPANVRTIATFTLTMCRYLSLMEVNWGCNYLKACLFVFALSL